MSASYMLISGAGNKESDLKMDE